MTGITHNMKRYTWEEYDLAVLSGYWAAAYPQRVIDRLNDGFGINEWLKYRHREIVCQQVNMGYPCKLRVDRSSGKAEVL